MSPAATVVTKPEDTPASEKSQSKLVNSTPLYFKSTNVHINKKKSRSSSKSRMTQAGIQIPHYREFQCYAETDVMKMPSELALQVNYNFYQGDNDEDTDDEDLKSGVLTNQTLLNKALQNALAVQDGDLE